MAADQKVKGSPTPGTTPARKRPRAGKVVVAYATPQDQARAREMAPLEPPQHPVEVKRGNGVAGAGRAAKVVAPRQRRSMTDGLTELEAYVIARLREAGDTLSCMPSERLGRVGGGERLLPMPEPAAIARMDDVLQQWMGWVAKTLDERMILSCYVAGMSWRSIAERDPQRRSHEGVRKAFLVLVRALALELVARDQQPPKWLLTELTKRR